MESPKESLDQVSKRVRKQVLAMVHASGSSHVGTSLSAVDILVSLYFKVLRIDPAKPSDPVRDRLILSKGHGCAALYATLVECGFANKKILEGFSVDGGSLWGHSTWKTMPGIEASTGSLGHGLPMGVGMALAAKADGSSRRIFVILGDGECDEGSVWESAMFAGHHKLDNLVAIVDYNKIQSLGSVKEVLDLEPFAAKWRAFGWTAQEINGHSHEEIVSALSAVPFEPIKPSVLIAHTVKGKGVSFMENQLAWHYKSPDAAQLKSACGEIDETITR